jgi:Uma2 family endonuclease
LSTQPKTFISPERYLEIERAAEFKSEYYNGEMFAMSGAREAHNLIAANAIAELRQQFRRRSCRVYPSDMRVFVSATGLYTYPDLVALYGKPEFQDGELDTLLNPSLIVEILSPSTEAYDRSRKFENYRSIESLREYLLIAADRVHADLYTRQTDGRWLLTSAGRLEDALVLESVDARLPMSDLYEKVEFPSGQNPGSRAAR